MRGWRGVTDAVHRRSSRIFSQLWHTGALSHPDFFDGALRCLPPTSIRSSKA
jgi:N-ethylmaleimide reductase